MDYKIVNTFQRRFAQGIRDDGKGIGNAVLADGTPVRYLPATGVKLKASAPFKSRL